MANLDEQVIQTIQSRKELTSKDAEQLREKEILDQRLSRIKHKIIVLSGKGGVGKSTVAVNLAFALRISGKHVGLLDIDIHGPSIPKMLSLNGNSLRVEGETIMPVSFDDNLKVMSIGFLIKNNDQAVIWRGPRKYGVIKQFLSNVEWGDLDYLVVDSPPGTGDEPLTIAQLIPDADGAVIVTTPQELAIEDVRKSIQFCQTLKLPVLGVIENMSGFVCPHCHQTCNIFRSGGGQRMASEMGVPFLGKIPIDLGIVSAGDFGKPFIYSYAPSKTSEAFKKAIKPLLKL